MEQVFVVRRQDFFFGNWPQGFLPLDTASAASLLQSFGRLGFFAARAEAEENPAWKQAIPYCVIRQTGQVFCVQRKTAQSESRLHGRLSIGIGGHINPVAGESKDGAEFFRRALAIELSEELHGTTQPDFAPQFLGLLNDDGDAVGKVHTGLVFAIDCAARNPAAEPVRVREVSKMAGGFRGLAELQPLWQDSDRFESWSRLLIDAGVAGPKAASRIARGSSSRGESTHQELG